MIGRTVDTLQLAADVIIVAVVGCTIFNVIGAVGARANGPVTRLDLRLAVWCAVAALAGCLLLWFALAG